MAGQRISTIVEVVASNTAERWRRSADYMCDGVADEIDINRALHTAYLMNTGDGSTGQLQGGKVHVAPGRYVLNSPIVVPGRVMLEFDQGAEITPGPGYLSGGTYAGCPLIAHYTARGFVSSATSTSLTTATYVDAQSGATKMPLTHLTSPAITGSQNSQPLVGAWIYVDHGGLGANLLAGRITAMSTNGLTATVNAWTNVTGAAGTPSANERFWVGPDPANGNLLFFPGMWNMRQGDRMHIKGGRFWGDTGGHVCGGLFTVVTSQNIWLPGSATTYPFFEGYPDSGHVVEGMKFSECDREAIITACGGSGTSFSFDNQSNTYRDIQTWHCGVGGSYAGVWFGSVDSTFSDSVIASSGSSTVGSGLSGCGIYMIGGNCQVRQCYVWFSKGVGVIMASARNHLSSCSIQDSETMGLHMFADRCTANDVIVDNSWNDQTTPAQRPAIYQEGGNSYCNAFVTNRSSDGTATHAIRYGASHGTFSFVTGRNLPGGAVVDSRGTATQATGHTVAAASTTNVNTVDSIYSVGIGLSATGSVYDSTKRVAGTGTSPGGLILATTTLGQIETDLVHPLTATRSYMFEGFFYYWCAATDDLLMNIVLSGTAAGSYSVDYQASFQRDSGTLVGPGVYYRYTAGAHSGNGVDSASVAVSANIQAIGVGTTFGGVSTRTVAVDGRCFAGSANCDIYPQFALVSDTSAVDGRILDGSWFRVKEV